MMPTTIDRTTASQPPIGPALHSIGAVRKNVELQVKQDLSLSVVDSVAGEVKNVVPLSVPRVKTIIGEDTIIVPIARQEYDSV